LLRRLVAAKARVTIPTATAVLDAEAEVITDLLKGSSRVRILNGIGSLQVKKLKARRRFDINANVAVDDPGRDRIVFVELDTRNSKK
jgi:nucleoid DNA-binding protein